MNQQNQSLKQNKSRKYLKLLIFSFVCIFTSDQSNFYEMMQQNVNPVSRMVTGSEKQKSFSSGPFITSAEQKQHEKSLFKWRNAER